MRDDLYYLDDTTCTTDLEAWARNRELTRRVGDWFRSTAGDVSTVFLGIDHSYSGRPPLLYEALVFGGPLDGEMERCSTRTQAEAMHVGMVERVRAAAKAVDALLALSADDCRQVATYMLTETGGVAGVIPVHHVLEQVRRDER